MSKKFGMHVQHKLHVYCHTHNTWAVGTTECPGWAYQINPATGAMYQQESTKDNVLMALVPWYELNYEAPPASITINGVKYTYAYSSQGGLKKGVSAYILWDIHKFMLKMHMISVYTKALTEEGKQRFSSVKEAEDAAEKQRIVVETAKAEYNKAVEARHAIEKRRKDGDLADNDEQYMLEGAEANKAETAARDAHDEAVKELEGIIACIKREQIGKRTYQKDDQRRSCAGTGAEKTDITFDENNSSMISDDVRTDHKMVVKTENGEIKKEIVVYKIDDKYNAVAKINENNFAGQDGVLYLGANWAEKVQKTAEKMGIDSDATIKFLQVRQEKGIAMVQPSVHEMCEKRNVKPEIDENGTEYIKLPNGEKFTDNSVVFTESTVKNKNFHDEWKDIIGDLVLQEVLATDTHYQYGNVKLNRQYFELLMARATNDEIEAVAKLSTGKLLSYGLGKGYMRAAKSTLGDITEFKSMEDAWMHPGVHMTFNKKVFNESHRAAAGKVITKGDCLVAVPDYDYNQDRLFEAYGFFDNNGKKAGTLGMREVEYEGRKHIAYEVRVPHAKERGLIGKIVVLARPPYITPYACIAIIVGDSFSDGVIECSMQEGSLIMPILACDFDGDHITVLYDEKIVHAAMRMNAFVEDCGYGPVVFDDMPSDDAIKVAEFDEFCPKARTLSDVGLATNPIFKLAAMLPRNCKPEDLIQVCGEKIIAKDLIWAMLMVNAAVTRATDAVKRGAPNGFNETKTGRMIGEWTDGYELSRLDDHCEELLGRNWEDTRQKMADRETDGKVAWINWNESACDYLNSYISHRLTGDPMFLILCKQYKDVDINNGGWISHPKRGTDWVGIPWWRWTTVEPKTLTINVNEFEGKIYVDLDGKEFVDADEARAMWTEGTEVNLDGDVEINLIYSRLYRAWERASKEASTWKYKVDLTERAREVCYSMIKAAYVAAFGPTDRDELHTHAQRLLYNNLGKYFMSASVTETTADELRAWINVPEFKAFMQEANDAWIASDRYAEDMEEIKAREQAFIDRVSDIKVMREIIKARRAELEEEQEEEEDEEDEFVDMSNAVIEEYDDASLFMSDCEEGDDEPFEEEY